MAEVKYSVVVPVYKNEKSISRLLRALEVINVQLQGQLEAVFVVDGSPDQSFMLLRDALDGLDFAAQLIVLSRNFGSFAAIRSGLAAAHGKYFGVMAADLQEPPELLIAFFSELATDKFDVTIGTRNSRNDPFISRMTSKIFWGLYRRLIVYDMPEGGVDIFGCNKNFRDQLLKLEEARSSLIALIFWLGFRRKFISYERQKRQEGKSSWTLSKKIDYMADSIFAFTDYPIRVLIRVGMAGSILSIFLGMLVIVSHFTGHISVPGYVATMMVILCFGMIGLLGLGVVGTYAWRGYENSKKRPLAVVYCEYSNQRVADVKH